MNSILLGSLICLTIIIITVFLLSFQHVTMQNMIQNNEENDVDKDEDMHKEDNKTDTNSKSKETNVLMNIGENENKIDIEETKLRKDKPEKVDNEKDGDEDAKCCFVKKYKCNGSKCTSGIQKRCGYFSGRSCDDSLVLCDLMTEKDCKLPPNNQYCEFNTDTNKCTNIPNAHDGMEIDCATYERYKKAGFMHTEYNCAIPLFLS